MDCSVRDDVAHPRQEGSPLGSRQHEGSVWDLDHTLISTDTFFEQAAHLLLRRPWLVLPAIWWIMRGRGYCKGRIAALASTPPSSWPVAVEVLNVIAAHRAEGRSTVLATGAHRLVAVPLAAHLGCFDFVLASDDKVNLKSHRKAKAIAALARDEQWHSYSYAGDSKADIAVWKTADEIVVVNPTTRLLERVRRLGKPMCVIGNRPAYFTSVLQACRPHQWAKNLLLFVPMLLAHKLDPTTIVHVVIAFVAFSFCASGVYVLNDIGDVASDRAHPRKRMRPFASGRLSLPIGFCLVAGLFTVGLSVCGIWLCPAFGALLVLYLVGNLAYTTYLKQVSVLDVLILSCMYALRLEAGAVAASAPLSDWFLTFSLFFFTSLAFAKRFTELTRLETAGGGVAAGRGYEVGDARLLEILGTASGYVSVLVLALYMNSDQMRQLYGDSRLLWLICPIVLFWITRLWFLAHRGELDEDPVVFALTDRTSLGVGAVCGIVVLLASVMRGR